jgi:hypothetical protein
MMPTLIIRSEVTGKAWQVWPEPEPTEPGAIQETGTYLFELRSAPGADGAELLIDDRRLEALRAPALDAARWRWSPGFHAGTIEAELRLPGNNPRRFEVVTDPDLRKLTRQDFDAMVREILEDTFALFSLSSFRKSIGHGSGTRTPPIARLEFLRSRIEELESVVASIVRTPRRRLIAEEKLLPYHRATRATSQEILRSFRSGRILAEEKGTSSRLPPALRGSLPGRIRVRQRRSSLDLPEHRQIGACLRAWAVWLSAVGEILATAAGRNDADVSDELTGWAVRCKRLARRLTIMASAAPFAEAGDAPPRLILSAIFRNDPPYRRFFRLSRDMNLGLAAVFSDFLDMPLARTFELYELWCFLRLVRAGAEEFGTEGLDIGDLFISSAAGGVTVAAGAVTITVGGGWKLCFQKQYREFWIEPSKSGSYSREMMPDVALIQDKTPAEASRLIVLDAKYRINDGLNAALNSIHTYRDALVHEEENGEIEGIVMAAYLLTPYVPEITAAYRDTLLPGRLFHPEYRTTFRFGAVTMRPGMTMAELRAVLRVIIADATT